MVEHMEIPPPLTEVILGGIVVISLKEGKESLAMGEQILFCMSFM